ncbi:uncharacterized protein LOC112593929 [Melanaphis sacchari]|uniref:Transcription elongation factor B polypeptide 1 n=1 Tax=Melanaphis sacchari TaxID=742174 RepID=A0A2H8TPB4_9HEMI|nr:uncharacterized protein LOC112593929 [Melanaphis sacchari]
MDSITAIKMISGDGVEFLVSLREASHSKMLNVLFSNVYSFSENQNSEITLKNIDSHTLDTIVKYIRWKIRCEDAGVLERITFVERCDVEPIIDACDYLLLDENENSNVFTLKEILTGFSYTADPTRLCCKYVRSNIFEIDTDVDIVCQTAVENGHLKCLRYARETGCPWNERVCELSAYIGYLDCLRYAHENGCPWDKKTCERAALGGSLDCLRYARENGCPWDEKTCEMAGFVGSLECLRYARENGCPWDEKTHNNAIVWFNLDCLEYVYKNDCPRSKYTDFILLNM